MVWVFLLCVNSSRLHCNSVGAFSACCCFALLKSLGFFTPLPYRAHSASLLLFLLEAWWIIAFVVSLHLAAALPQHELPSALR